MVLLKLLTTTLITVSLFIVPVAARHEKRQLEIVWADKRDSVVPRAPLSVENLQEREIRLPPQSRASKSGSGAQKRSPTKTRRTPPPPPPPPNPSNTPFSGKIQVKRVNNDQSLGYIEKNYYNSNTERFGLTTSSGSALSISGTWDSVGPVQLTMTNGPDSTYPYLGFATISSNTGSNNGNDMSSNSHNAFYATGTKSIPANSPPSSNGNDYTSTGKAESTIWRYDTVTKRLTAQWVNTDSSKPTTVLYYVSSTDTLFIGGSNTQVNNAIPVYLTVV